MKLSNQQVRIMMRKKLMLISATLLLASCSKFGHEIPEIGSVYVWQTENNHRLPLNRIRLGYPTNADFLDSYLTGLNANDFEGMVYDDKCVVIPYGCRLRVLSIGSVEYKGDKVRYIECRLSVSDRIEELIEISRNSDRDDGMEAFEEISYLADNFRPVTVCIPLNFWNIDLEEGRFSLAPTI